MGLIQNNPRHVFSFVLTLILSLALSRSTRIEILNNCTDTAWAAANPGGGKQLKQGETWTLNNITGNGRIWGRTNCVFDRDGRGKCESGDCNGLLNCEANGRAPNTVAVYSIKQAYDDKDVFYVSVVEGFNIPMEFSPAGLPSNCSEMSRCAADVNGACPMELRDPGGCNNPCTVFGNSQFCCTSGMDICEPTRYSKFFMDLCLNAFTFPNDVGQRSFCPTGIDYNVVFCPLTTNKSQNFSQDCLIAHNTARADVGVPPMAWDTTLENYAREFTTKHVGDCTLEHSHGPYGENLAWSSGDLSCSDAVRLWTSEKTDYNYSINTCASGRVCGQYTQVVWRDSVHLGCAGVRCYNNMGTFISCTYSPPGNYMGKRPY